MVWRGGAGRSGAGGGPLPVVRRRLRRGRGRSRGGNRERRRRRRGCRRGFAGDRCPGSAGCARGRRRRRSPWRAWRRRSCRFAGRRGRIGSGRRGPESTVVVRRRRGISSRRSSPSRRGRRGPRGPRPGFGGPGRGGPRDRGRSTPPRAARASSSRRPRRGPGRPARRSATAAHGPAPGSRTPPGSSGRRQESPFLRQSPSQQRSAVAR
mmetsp:Transcript_38587/g.123676  ORF Transcript_38587/g.123676 Transcript_38587/m.123676 type:complete len:209 (-) Transcript_38587:1389-2015(-)